MAKHKGRRSDARGAATRFAELLEHSPLGYATLDGAGLIRKVNVAAATVLRQARARLVGRRLEPLVAIGDRAALQELLAAALNGGGAGDAAIEVGLAPRDGPTPPAPPVYVRLTARRAPAPSEVVLFVEDVSERRRAEERLRKADRRKCELLATLVHELRTPLAAIVNATQVLEHDPAGEAATRARRVVRRQADHLVRLVDDLLDVGRIERGKLVLRPSRLELRELLLRVAEDFRGVLEGRGVTFHVVVPDASVWLEADATRLTQIVGNLLGNAAKFTRSGDEVVLSLGCAGGMAELRVKDSGVGIDPALLPQIFRAFVQGERTAARGGGGLGLGLAVVKALTELHGGTVRAESAGVGRGAEVVIRLPVLAAPATT